MAKLISLKTLTITQMIKLKGLAIKKLEKLEEELTNKCSRQNLSETAGFTIMFDSENGRTIRFVKDMPIELTQSMKEFYDKKSPNFYPEYRNINWPYTGFVQGNIAGWNPISTLRLADWFDRYNYETDEFIEKFTSN